jgi:hypothetical protein
MCVKCGGQNNVTQIKRNFGWHPPWLYLLIIPGVLIYAIVASILMKRAMLQVPLCEEHRAARRRKLVIGTILLVGFLPFGIAVTATAPDYAGWAWLIAIAMFFAGLFITALAFAILKPSFIDDNVSVYKGACDTYLGQLPQRNAVS